MPIFNTNSRKGYNICKNFQIGSAILMAQMTNQMKTKLTDYFHLVSGLKVYNFRKFFENGSRFFPKTALKIVFWTTPLGTKVSKRVLLFRQKFQKGSIERPYSGTPPSENIMSSPLLPRFKNQGVHNISADSYCNYHSQFRECFSFISDYNRRLILVPWMDFTLFKSTP